MPALSLYLASHRRQGPGGLPGFGSTLTCLAGDVGGKTAKGVISEGHLEKAGNATVV